jgi:hypothetical protein
MGPPGLEEALVSSSSCRPKTPQRKSAGQPAPPTWNGEQTHLETIAKHELHHAGAIERVRELAEAA